MPGTDGQLHSLYCKYTNTINQSACYVANREFDRDGPSTYSMYHMYCTLYDIAYGRPDPLVYLLCTSMEVLELAMCVYSKILWENNYKEKVISIAMTTVT